MSDRNFGMDEEEEVLATRFYNAVQRATHDSPRSKQAKQGFQIGVSDLGFCSERTRRIIAEEVPEETDMLLAWLGTAIGDHAEQAWMSQYPNSVRQAKVEVILKGDRAVYRVPGHLDLILPDEGIVLDVKTDYGLETPRRSGPSQQQQFQRHCYALGAWEAEYFPKFDRPEDIRVANIWIDRSGIQREFHVDMEHFRQGVVDEAAVWLDEVVYAYLHDEEAQKEPPRDMCEVICGFYRDCRLRDTDVTGLITDPEELMHIEMYREGKELEKEGKRLKDEAKQHLRGVSGSTGEVLVRWTNVNESVVPEYVRAGYEKIDIRPLPKGRRR